MKRLLIVTGILLASLTGSHPAQAGGRDLVICMPGSPGTTAGAQAYMAPFFRRIESLAAWPASTINGSFHPTYTSCLARVSSIRPGFAVLSLGVYLEQRKRLKLRVIGQVDILYGAGHRLYLVVKKGAYTSLAQLQGKRLTSDHLEETTFLSKVMFGGKIDVTTHFKLKKVRATTKGMRDVKRGRADATIINDEQLRIMKRRGYPLVVLHKSPRLPGAPLVALGSYARRGDISKMNKVVSTMCSGPLGRKLCRNTGIKSVRKATNRTYAKMVRLFGK
jgi:ABC-type phosphate/phosphonate transport system substrate-binding protein